MTNMEYIMSKMNDRKLADMFLTVFYGFGKSPTSKKISKAFHSEYTSRPDNRELTIDIQIWLSKQYSGKWEI